ncbi:MAG: NADP-dependent oxidoreductase [Nanoarchaeota archaeon]|nr:MAG: NADP-dependent oxidoreductase [Nanoarchaeota archaeon]
MKAAQISRYGKDAIEIKEIPEPKILEGKVLVEIYAASANPVDWKIRDGLAHKWMPVTFPATLGGDFSGKIVKGSSEFKQGDEVYGSAFVLSGGTGTFAEYAATKEGLIALKPKTIDYLQAAALPLAGVSAWQGLVEHIGIKRNQKILIHGGAGGIGVIAVQIAKHFGAHVATTVSSKDIQIVKMLGADDVIDYKSQKFEEIVHDYDAVFDTVGEDTYTKSFRVLKKGGIIVSMVGQPSEELMKQFGVKAILQFTQINTERLTKISELVDKGAIKIIIDKVYSLEKAAEALDHLENGHPKGKVVIEVKSI